MARPSQEVIQKFARDTFAIALADVVEKRAETERQALDAACRTGNRAAYPDVLGKLATDRVVEMILAGLNSYLDVFTNQGIPADVQSEKYLERAGLEILADTIQWIQGQLNLHGVRAGRTRTNPGGHLYQTVAKAMVSALKKGVFLLNEQRKKAKKTTNQARSRSIPESGAKAIPLLKPGAPISMPAKEFGRAMPQLNAAPLDLDTFGVCYNEFTALAKQDETSKPEPLLIWVSYQEEDYDFGTYRPGYGAGKSLRAAFENTATRAGIALGAPAGVKPLTFFLHHLFLSLSDDDPEKHLSRGTAKEQRAVQRVCAASATYCRQLATKALEQRHALIGVESQPIAADSTAQDGRAVARPKDHSGAHPGKPDDVNPASCDNTGGVQAADTDKAIVAKQARALTVAKLIKELYTLKPQMFEDEQEYDRLRGQYPEFLVFKIVDSRSDLKRKVLSIRASTRHVRLAQELAGAQYGRTLSTIQDDWKDHKPVEFRRQS